MKNLSPFSNMKREISNFLDPEKSGYFSFRLQTFLTEILSRMGFNPWCKLRLPYGLACLYNASEQTDGSISDVFFQREYFLLNEYKIAKRNVVIDVGAYVGLYSILSAKLAGNDGFVVSIEPQLHSYCLLKDNIKLNDLDKSTLQLNIGLSDENGNMYLYVPEFASGSTFHLNHLLSQAITRYKKISVQTRTCDYLLEKLKIKHVNIMKIDVEGAELSVLKGASESLKNCCIDKLVIEVHKTINNPRTINDYLKSNGYSIDAYVDINEHKGMFYARCTN